jgi:autotransporter-associated beta strand protein
VLLSSMAVRLAPAAEAVTYHGTYVQSGSSATKTGQTYTASAQDTSGVWVTGSGVLTLDNCEISTSGNTSSNDSSSFYGLNAGVLASQGTITMTGGSVTTTGTGANAIFAYGSGSSITVSNVTVDASAGGGHGIMCSGGGTITATNLTMTTRGANSGVIATDRGGGTIIVTGGTVLATGQDSPGIYSTGDIQVTGATISATGSESAVIEGANSITLTNTDLSSSKAGKWGVMVYQSMSGDAQGNKGVFTMTGGSLANTATTGPLFFVTNTNGVITLKGVTVTAGSGTLLEAGATSRWGTSGSNGGKVTFTADGQSLTGNLVTDDAISSITAALQNASSLTGAVSSASLTVDSTSSWNVTGASKLPSLTSAGTIAGTGTVTATTATVQAGTIGAVLAGSGGLTKSTDGAATLSAANTYTGATTIAAGRLNLTGSLASSSVTVSSGAALAGTGSLSGSLTVASGASLVLGTSGHIRVAGNLALSGAVTVVPAADPLPAGTYTLVSYGGALSGSASFAYSSPSGQTATFSTSTTGQVTVTVGSGMASLSITTASPLLGGQAGVSYSATLEATGGTTPYTWSVASGSLPGGLTLSPAGAVSGTPTAAGTFTFTAQVTDHAAATASKAFTVTIAAAALSITTASPLPSGQVGVSYSATLEATGGTTPYTWSVASGSLPGGLTLSPAGAVSGTPTAAGTFAFTAQVTDHAAATASKSFTIAVATAIVLFPGVASQAGWNGTQWRSEVELYNPDTASEQVQLEIVARGGSAVAARGTRTVLAGQTLRIADLYAELGAPGGAGMLRVTGAVLAWARTYNLRSDGTLGQDLPRVAPAEAYSVGQVVYFPVATPATLASDFRSNLVLVNPGSAAITCTLTSGLHSQAWPVPAEAYVQVNNVGGSLGLGAGTAVMQVTGSGPWSGYVSTIDPSLGDPSTMAGLLEVGDTVRLFPAVASTGGQNDTSWQTQVVLGNDSGATSTVLLELLPRGSSTVSATRSVTLRPGEVLDVADLWDYLGAETGAGMLRVSGDVLTWVRSYNQGATATFGQDVPPVAPQCGFAARTGIAFPVSTPTDVATDFRSNLAVVNLETTAITLTVTSGGLSQLESVPAGSYVQVNGVGSWLGLASGWATITVTGDGRWSGVVSTIDPTLGDPTTVIGLPDRS